MNIWLITIGEPIYHPQNKLRMHRTGILSKLISNNRKDINVTWWTSTFNHFTKMQMFENTIKKKLEPNLSMIAINGGGYSKNVSLKRVLDHRKINIMFKEMCLLEEKPDIIVASFPTIGLCESAINFANQNNIPILIDYRDLWPEVYIDLIPKPLRFFGKILFYPLIQRVNKIFQHATGLIGVTDSFLNIALEKARRQKNNFDAVFPLGYLKNQFEKKDIDDANIYWGDLLSKEAKLRVCFFGAIGYQSDWETIISCISQVYNQNLPIEFVICGSGDKLQDIKNKTKLFKNVIFPGFVSASKISSLMKLSDFGLCAFLPKENYLNAIPGKSIEYMSGGIPILNSLENSDLGNIIKIRKIGFNYDSDEALLFILKNVLSGQLNLAEMKSNSIKLYNEQFDSSAVYMNYLSHMENCISLYKSKKTL
jgi:glycosyltransferase involved in cell wall biosynthesis